MRLEIPVFGNGDISRPEKAKIFKERYGVDGIMIGRASIGHPWIFREIKHYLSTGELLPPPTLDERIEACREHVVRSVEWKGEKLGILEMRRHYANYFRGYQNARPIRTQLVTVNNLSEILEILELIPSLLQPQTKVEGSHLELKQVT